MEFLWSPAGRDRNEDLKALSPATNNKHFSCYLPLQGGAWQVRFVIGLGSLQLWDEGSVLEQTT